MNLATIQHLFGHSAPFVSIHADVSRDSEDARQQIDSRWTNVRHELEHAGVDAALIDRIGERLLEPTHLPGEVRRTLVAADGDVVFEDDRAAHTALPEHVTCGPLPDLNGWLHQVDGEVPFLLVLADREGADIDFYRAASHPTPDHQEVHGETLHIHKVPTNDWAEKQIQRTSENVWAANAREVADTVRSVVAKQRPRVVVIAGDQRARAEIVSELEGLPCEVQQVEAGGRAEGASTEALWKDVRVVLARAEADDEQEISGRLLEASGQGQGAARGLSDVLDALVQGQVQRLVLDLQAAHELTVRPADHPGLALPSGADKEDELPADQVLVAAGAATDAELSLLPTEQSKGAGVAALLRWDDRPESNG